MKRFFVILAIAGLLTVGIAGTALGEQRHPVKPKHETQHQMKHFGEHRHFKVSFGS